MKWFLSAMFPRTSTEVLEELVNSLRSDDAQAGHMADRSFVAAEFKNPFKAQHASTVVTSILERHGLIKGSKIDLTPSTIRYFVRNRHPLTIGPRGELIAGPILDEIRDKILTGMMEVFASYTPAPKPALQMLAMTYARQVEQLNGKVPISNLYRRYKSVRESVYGPDPLITPLEFGFVIVNLGITGTKEYMSITIPSIGLQKFKFEKNPLTKSLGEPYPPEIPPVIEHKQAETIAKHLMSYRRLPAWAKQTVILEFPLGELMESAVKTMLLTGGLHVTPVPLTGKERFDAQGLEGKVQLEKPLSEAVMLLLKLIPPRRGRILTHV